MDALAPAHQAPPRAPRDRVNVPRSVLLTGTRAAATLDLARRLRREGIRVIGADSMRFPLGSFSNAFASHHRVPAAAEDRDAFVDAVATLAERERVDLVWPTCEEVLHLAAGWPDRAARIPLFAPPIHALELLHHKFRFAEWTLELGSDVRAPTSWPGEAFADPPADDGFANASASRAAGVIWKPVHSRFAAHTRLTPPLGDRAGWMAQRLVEGAEFCSWALCVEGEVRVLAQYRSLARFGRGAGCALEPTWSEAAADFTARAAVALGCTGALAFDFIEAADGSGTHVIECNPRMTSGIHVLDPSVPIGPLFERPLHPPGRPPLQRPAKLAAATFLVSPRLALDSAIPDVMADERDPRPAWTQGLGFAEFVWRALSHRTSLLDATTLDIAYDGR